MGRHEMNREGNGKNLAVVGTVSAEMTALVLIGEEKKGPASGYR